jgi:hypothetical protein
MAGDNQYVADRNYKVMCTLRKMELHEELRFGDHLKVVRVPNGWLYYYQGYVTFVPEKQ